MIEFGKCVLLALLLTALTGFLGSTGLQVLYSHRGGAFALSLFVLPFWLGFFTAGLIVGILAQVLACLALVAAIRWMVRLNQRGTGGGDGVASSPDRWIPPDTLEIETVLGVADGAAHHGDRASEPTANEG